uniref:Uncharacterized protein n=1 Tax=Monopterus albus TaxID=43700 RepID=A0A3Q3JN54_MONAL
MHHHQERGADREEVVKADVVAPGLSCVAFEVFLFITPYLLCRHHKHQYSEEENNREPHSPKGCGIFVHATEEALEECPVHDEVCLKRFTVITDNLLGTLGKCCVICVHRK